MTNDSGAAGTTAWRGPQALRLAAFVAAILLTGFAVGYFSDPKASYDALAKPGFAPPAWLFGPVWTVLYVMIGVVGWRISERAPRGAEMLLWWVQMLLNVAWTPVFFMAGSRGAALGVIGVLLLAILLLVARLWRSDRTAAALLLPYLAWVGFAAILNAEIVRLNAGV